MARIAEGWKLVWRRGVARVRFRLQGKRQELSTLQRDPIKAAEVAARIYSDFVSGRTKRASSGALINPGTPLDELCALWIADVMPELGKDTDLTYEIYARHWCAHMKTIGDVNSAGIGNYQRQRLTLVQRSTVIKERGGLRRFLEWCEEQEMLRGVPEFPKLKKKVTGVRHKQARSKPQVELSPNEIERILAALPEKSLRTRKGKHFAVRARFEFAYETGLRPETLNQLRGADVTVSGLHLRPEADKNRRDRVVPLSERALAALRSLGPIGRDELLFGVHDYRTVFGQACVDALGDERGAQVTQYDLKHARVTHLIDDGAPITGIRFLTGTNVALESYAHPSRRAAEQALGGLSGNMARPKLCEGEDLNLHGSYPASTSIESESTNRGEFEVAVVGNYAALRSVGTLSGNGPPNHSRAILMDAREALALAAERVLFRDVQSAPTASRKKARRDVG